MGNRRRRSVGGVDQFEEVLGFKPELSKDTFDERSGGADVDTRIVLEELGDTVHEWCHLPTDLEGGWYNWTLTVQPGSPAGLKGVSGEVGFGDALFAEQAHHAAGATFADMVRTHEDQAYLLTVVPTVLSLSHKTSGSLGGHEVVLTGTGFHEEQGEGCSANQVLLAGVACEVTECTRSMLRCTVAPWLNAVAGSPTPGTTGLAGKTWGDKRSGSLDGWEEDPDYGNPLAWTKTSIGGTDGRGAFVKDFGSNFADEHVGYFVAPLTSQYRFWVSGDDLAAVWINKNGTSFDGLEKVVEVSNSVVAAKSEPISLAAGERYAIRTRHIEFSGSDWMLAGVEVLDAPTAADGAPHHPHTQYHRVKEIQRVELTATKRDQVQTITVRVHVPRLRCTGCANSRAFLAHVRAACVPSASMANVIGPLLESHCPPYAIYCQSLQDAPCWLPV